MPILNCFVSPQSAFTCSKSIMETHQNIVCNLFKVRNKDTKK